MQKFIAYFMHEKEEILIGNNMRNATKTESFFIGELDQKNIESLRKEGIIFNEIEDIDDHYGNYFENYSVPTIHHILDMNYQISNEQVTAGYPAYYTFIIIGPFLEKIKESLEKISIDIIELISSNKYLIKIESFEQHLSLRKIPDIKHLRYYSSLNTYNKNLEIKKSFSKNLENEKKLKVFDILLHKKEDKDYFKEWLEKSNIKIIGYSDYKFRVYLYPNSSDTLNIAEHPMIRTFNEFVKPKFHNDLAKKIIGLSDQINADFEYEGTGQIIGVADSGIDIKHLDLQGQIYDTPSAWGRHNDFSDKHGHGTHVAGSIVGNGKSSNGKIKGTAPKAKVFFQSIMNDDEELNLPIDLHTLFDEAYIKGARIHNNSWGSSTKSTYTINSTEVDDYVWKNKDMLLVFSAGNDGSCKLNINAPAGYPEFLSIGSPASAKNVLTVGASRSTRNIGGYSTYSFGDIWPDEFSTDPTKSELISGNSEALAGFSSRGPCDDNRIKPDIVAPGTDIVSIKSATASLSNFWGAFPGNKFYAIMGGTSMSAPIVSGCAALIREYYIMRNISPSASLIKATLINGAKKITANDSICNNPNLPNYNQGFGLVNMPNTIPSKTNDFKLFPIDNYNNPLNHFKATGQRKRVYIKLKEKSWLKICLAYSDYPGRALQNNINIMLDYEAASQKKWIGNENATSILKMLDAVNNVETIQLDNAEKGEYCLQIVASNIIKGPQDYSIVISCGDLNSSITNQ